MEVIKEIKRYVILIINNVKGNILRLNTILEKISKQKKIDYLILTGEVFALSTKKEDILSILYKGPIIIFDSSPLGEIIRAKFEYKNYILQNNIFLSKSGIYTLEGSSINIAFLSGLEAKEFLENKNINKFKDISFTNNFYKYKDISNLINNYENLHNNKIDFFLINNFPKCYYDKYIDTIEQECDEKNTNLNKDKINNSISYSLNYLLHLMNPRYVITSVDDFNFKNVDDIILNNKGYRTFFYNLGYMEDKKNKNENFWL